MRGGDVLADVTEPGSLRCSDMLRDNLKCDIKDLRAEPDVKKSEFSCVVVRCHIPREFKGLLILCLLRMYNTELTNLLGKDSEVIY